ALAEGMACGLPPVATDVGDAAAIVGTTGLLVPPADPDALAKAIRALSEEPGERRAERGRQARSRIVENFSLARALEQFSDAYATLWQSGARGGGGRGGAEAGPAGPRLGRN